MFEEGLWPFRTIPHMRCKKCFRLFCAHILQVYLPAPHYRGVAFWIAYMVYGRRYLDTKPYNVWWWTSWAILWLPPAFQDLIWSVPSTVLRLWPTPGMSQPHHQSCIRESWLLVGEYRIVCHTMLLWTTLTYDKPPLTGVTKANATEYSLYSHE